MMKKILSSILCILMLLGLFLVPASAERQTATFFEDLSAFYTETATYHRHDTSMLLSEYWGESENFYEVEFLTEDPAIKEITLERSENSPEFYAQITYQDGSSLSCTYLREDLIPTYEQLLNATDADCEIDFSWPDDNQIDTDLSILMAEPTQTLGQKALEWCDYFEVYAYNSNRDLQVAKGQLLTVEDRYYYIDYSENDIHSPWAYPGDYKILEAHPITDEALIAELEAAEDAYNGIGSPFGEALTQAIGIFLLVLIFGLVPAGLAILAIIVMIRSKKPAYKKIGLWLLIPSGITLLLFIGLTLMILLL